MVQNAVAIVKAGCGRLQINAGGDVRGDIDRVIAVASAVPRSTNIFCDANAGWQTFQALQFADATRAVDYVFEQPCRTIAGCLSVCRRLDKPLVLDEPVTSLEDLLEIHRTGTADGVTLKISRLDGAEIDTAAIAHLSLSTPEERRLHTVAFHQWVKIRTAANARPVENSRMSVPEGLGLGIDVVRERLEKPFLTLPE